MIEFREINNKVILSYSSEYPGPAWVYHELDENNHVTISKAFSFTRDKLISALDKENEDAPVEFEVANREGVYYCFPKDILSLEHDLYIHEDVRLDRKLFVAERNISIFPKIDQMVAQSIYIGGNHENAVPASVYRDLLKKFPNTYELNRYASARVSSILS
ncbi:DUF4263 domain-containing protein, partial [bacterium]|nr:DUF4263 domain-containing protein [bacterium]